MIRLNVIKNIPIDVVSVTTLNIISKCFLDLMYIHPVTLSLITKPIGQFSESMYYDGPELNCENLLVKKIINEGWNYIPFPGITSIEVYSNKNYAENPNCHICDFHYVIEGHEITVKDIIECVFRMKSNKQDFCYESFDEIKKLTSAR